MKLNKFFVLISLFVLILFLTNVSAVGINCNNDNFVERCKDSCDNNPNSYYLNLDGDAQDALSKNYFDSCADLCNDIYESFCQGKGKSPVNYCAPLGDFVKNCGSDVNKDGVISSVDNIGICQTGTKYCQISSDGKTGIWSDCLGASLKSVENWWVGNGFTGESGYVNCLDGLDNDCDGKKDQIDEDCFLVDVGEQCKGGVMCKSGLCVEINGNGVCVSKGQNSFGAFSLFGKKCSDSINYFYSSDKIIIKQGNEIVCGLPKKKGESCVSDFVCESPFFCISGICSEPSYSKIDYLLDSLNSLVLAEDENGISSLSKSDSFGNLVSIKNAYETSDEATAEYKYDSLGRLIEIRDAENRVTTNNYNSLGQIIEENHPDTGRTTFEYDLNGNVIKTIDALGRVIIYDYDTLNRLEKVDFKGDGIYDILYFYDNNCNNAKLINSWGRVCKVVDTSGKTEFVYDKKGQVLVLKKTISGVVFKTQYNYDSAGNIIQIVYPSGRKINYEYNALSQLNKVLFEDGNSEKVLSEYSYNPTGTIKDIGYGNSISTQYDYDIRDRLKTLGTLDIYERSYDYDLVGNIMKTYSGVSSGNLASEFSYDSLYRIKSSSDLISGSIQNFVYDKLGNRISSSNSLGSVSQSYNYQKNSRQNVQASLSNFLESSKSDEGGQNFVYDSVGNLIINNGNVYEYDILNRLIAVKDEQGNLVEKYFYDYGGNRVKKVAESKTTIYIYGLGIGILEEVSLVPAFSKLDLGFEESLLNLEENLVEEK